MKFFPKLPYRLFFGATCVFVCTVLAARGAVDTVTTTADSGPGSLRNTIGAASPGDTIIFSPTLAGQTIYLTTGELLIGQNLIIDASALSGGILIDGGGSSRVMEIGTGTFVNLNALTVTNGYVYDDSGGGVLMDDSTCSLIASNCVFCGNSTFYGGAIASLGTLTLNNCLLAGNSANYFGGGIFSYEGVITLNNCMLSDNSAFDEGGGGGIDSEFCVLTLNNCIVSNNVAADFGGGIYAEDIAQGSIALTNCVFTGNQADSAGALSADTPATINDCAFSNNISTAGGAIVNADIMTLCNCTLSGNLVSNSGVGGGMVNSGILTMNYCAVSGNSATNGLGGGVYNTGAVTADNCTLSGNTVSGNVAGNNVGGGICNDGIMTLNNCTLSGNCATNGLGGALFGDGVSTNIVVNCTICSNSAAEGFGGGIYNEGIAVLTNAIVAGNAATAETDVSGSYSGVANFIGGNPQLAALGNYGGPTMTMPPLFGSPVIDAGTDWVTNFLAADQRGYPRLSGAHVDIGAVEWQHFVVLNNNDSGNGSLRAILTNSPDYVTFTNTLAGQTIHLTSGELIVSNITTIDASALPGGVIIDGGGVSRVFQINNVSVTLNSLTVTNGNAGAGNGGGIENGGTLTLNHCIVSGNAAPYGSGGGIDYRYDAATLINCAISGNSAGNGGGFYCYDGALTLSNCIVSSNSAIDGGGIDCGASTLTLNNCTFTGDSARDIGGGVDGGGLEGGTLEVTNCTFIGSSADQGGAMEWGGLGTLDNCTISTNVAQNGAGILNDYGTLTLYNCTLDANTATNGGGGAISSDTFLTANNCTFSGNSATNAGAIANSWDMTLSNCILLGNSATVGNGGAIYNYWILTLDKCSLTGNTATNGNGGGAFNWHTLMLNGCTLDANGAINGGGIADSYGGGDFSGSILSANSCTFLSNTATNGGGIFNAVSMTLNNCTLAGNSANAGYGGAICNESADAIYGDYASNFVVNCTVYGNHAPGGSGGGFYNDTSSTLALTNTIVASNSADADNDVYGAYSGVANFVGGNPQLAETANYGGGLLTLAPMFGSPVIDAGTDWVTNFLATDQRGYPRLAGAHVDIGAVEAQTAPANDRPVLKIGVYIFENNNSLNSFRLSFTNAANADFTVFSSTNLTLPMTQWTEIGNAPGSGGRFQFLAPGNSPAQFFRVVSP